MAKKRGNNARQMDRHHGIHVALPLIPAVQHVALYMRVSSEDQAESGTIGTQRDFLRSCAQLYHLTTMEEYVDDGVTGTMPLGERPERRRLLQDASTGRFGCVLVYRVDRLGRSLTALLDAHTELSKEGVTIRSATEPFDTATPIGTFLFQLLGSLAELEKSTLQERMTLGRDRVAQQGQWTNGPIPFGYDLATNGCLVPSTRWVDVLGMTEAELVRDLFQRIADGSTLVEECRRLTVLGVPSAKRYRGGVTARITSRWLPGRLQPLIHNPVYTGRHVLQSRHGPIEREAPALIDRALWEQARAQLRRSQSLP
jgi:site-specific DNA recombinase